MRNSHSLEKTETTKKFVSSNHSKTRQTQSQKQQRLSQNVLAAMTKAARPGLGTLTPPDSAAMSFWLDMTPILKPVVINKIDKNKLPMLSNFPCPYGYAKIGKKYFVSIKKPSRSQQNTQIESFVRTHVIFIGRQSPNGNAQVGDNIGQQIRQGMSGIGNQHTGMSLNAHNQFGHAQNQINDTT